MRLTSSPTFQRPVSVDDLRRLIEQRQLSTSFREQTIMKAFIVDRYKKRSALRFGDMPEPEPAARRWGDQILPVLTPQPMTARREPET
jgi:hypothetical protein